MSSVFKSVVLRYKLKVVLAVSVYFTGFAVLVSQAFQGPALLAAVDGMAAGLIIGIFEEFYFHGPRGAWMRRMRPLVSIPIYAAIGCTMFLAIQHATAHAFGGVEQLRQSYARYHIIIPLVFLSMALGILALRVIGFVGARTLVDLLIGRYLRPTVERKVLLFLDMEGSTATVQSLGQAHANAFIAKFLFDVSRPVTEHGGDIYLYTGDGLIGMWDWDRAVRDNTIVAAVDAIRAAVERERPNYQSGFGRTPAFRIGIHGGEVVIGEQGDTKRSIGVYGDTINIAARLEQMAKEVGVRCIISAAVAGALPQPVDGLMRLDDASVRGIAEPVAILAYPEPAGETR